MEEFINRLIVEEKELADRVIKLQSFIEGKLFIKLDAIQRDLLTTQLSNMQGYLSCLSERINLLS